VTHAIGGADATEADPSPDHGGLLPRSVVGPKGGRPSGRNILVVSTVEHSGALLRRYIGPADAIKVVVPVVRQGILDWLANDERAFSQAEDVAERTAAELPGKTVDSSAGEADMVLAIRDALATFAADEIVVAVRKGDDEGIIESMATHDTRKHRSIDGIPVRCVVVAES
jgi:hypothetical protein